MKYRYKLLILVACALVGISIAKITTTWQTKETRVVMENHQIYLASFPDIGAEFKLQNMAQVTETEFLAAAMDRYKSCETTPGCFRPNYLDPMLNALIEDNARVGNEKRIHPRIRKEICSVSKRSGYWHIFHVACSPV